MGLNPNEFEVTPAEEIARDTKGVIKTALYKGPNQNGTSSLEISIEYPEGEADKSYYDETLYFHEGDMALDKVTRKETLTPGRLGWVNRGIQTLQELAKAASINGKTFTLDAEGAGNLVDAPVKFGAKPDKEDQTKLKLTQLVHRNGNG